MNIEVVLTVPTDEELDKMNSNFIFDSTSNVITCDGMDGVEKQYSLDGVYTFANFPSVCSPKIVNPLIQDVVEGYHTYLFLCGTRESSLPQQTPGIVRQLLLKLIEYSERFHRIEVSVLEVYSESIRDLLSPNSQVSLKGFTIVGNEYQLVKSQLDIESIMNQVDQHHVDHEGLAYLLFRARTSTFVV
jgi:hypothetical protein